MIANTITGLAAIQEGHFIRTGTGIKQKIIPTESEMSGEEMAVQRK
ncbi:MAG: hypothetical protein IKP88_04705 [Lachnospiraceae bacterium]|nr:hypothetical protein [Lachnospiraceae bacterium]